jgi:ribosomal protein S27E
VINVSTTGDRPLFLNENDNEHFLRIPVNDCLNEQILPYFDKAYAFIGK